MPYRVVVFAPHPDDEILGCGGTIAKKLRQGCNISIVYMTDGRNCLTQFGIHSQPSPAEIKEIRKKEAQRATKIIGINQEDLIFLDIEDGSLARNETTAQKKIAEILTENCPSEVYLPTEIEYHTNHRTTNRLVRNTVKQLHLQPLEYQYAIAWLPPLSFVRFIPSRNLRNAIMTRVLGCNMESVEISDFIHLKEAALREFDSQFDIVSQKQRKPALSASFVRPFLEDKEEFFTTK